MGTIPVIYYGQMCMVKACGQPEIHADMTTYTNNIKLEIDGRSKLELYATNCKPEFKMEIIIRNLTEMLTSKCTG